MAQRSISPWANPYWAGAASNLAGALFPNGKSEAAGRMAGQQLAEITERTRKQRAEAFGIEDQNSALAAAALEAAGFDPQTVAIMRAGRGNAGQLADAFQTITQVGADDAAGAAFEQGNFPAVGGARLRGGRDPLKTNEIDTGYRLNPYETGGAIEATGETLADIAAANALARQRNAGAGYDEARTANPERFRAPGAEAKPTEISPSEAKALDDLVGNYLPSVGAGDSAMAAEIDASLRNEVLTRAAQLFRETGNAQQSVAQAFGELVQQTQVGAPAVAAQDNLDLWGLGTPDVEAQPARPNKFSRRTSQPAESASAVPPEAQEIARKFKAGEISEQAARAALAKLGIN